MKMEWDWLGRYPIFVYMTYITRGKWHVKVVKGVKGNQNIGDNSPKAPAWFTYETNPKDELISKFDVFNDAWKRAKWKLKAEELIAS